MIRLGLSTTFVILFLWAPLVLITIKGLQPESLSKLLANEAMLEAFLSSLSLALVTAVLSTVMATFTAFALPKMPRWQRSLTQAGLLFPMVMPEIALGLALMSWFVTLQFPFGWTTLLLGHVAFAYAFCTLIMKSAVQSLDWSHVDAARDLGASYGGVFRHALAPQLKNAWIASMVTAFSLSLDDFLISFFVKGVEQMTLPIKLFSMLRLGVSREIYALSFILFCLSLLSVLVTQIWFSQKLQKKHSPRFS